MAQAVHSKAPTQIPANLNLSFYDLSHIFLLCRNDIFALIAKRSLTKIFCQFPKQGLNALSFELDHQVYTTKLSPKDKAVLQSFIATLQA